MTTFWTTRGGPHGTRRSLAFALLVTLASPLDEALAADAGPERPAPVQDAASLAGLGEILNILSSSAADGNGRGLALAHLVAKGPRSVPAIFAILSGTAPIPAEILKKGPLLTRERKNMLFEAMRSWDSRRVAEELEVLFEGPPEPTLTQRVVAVRMLGEIGNARCVETFISIIGDFEPDDIAHPAVRGPALEGLAETLRRDPMCYVVLSAVLRDLDAQQLEFAVDAMANAGRAEGVEILAELLDRSPELDRRVLAALGTLDAREFARTGPRVCALVRPYLSSADAETRLHAARTLGKLRDAQSFGELIDLLSDADESVVLVAVEALRGMSGTAWPPAPVGWQRWYERERTWLEIEATALCDELETGSPERAMKAIPPPKPWR